MKPRWYSQVNKDVNRKLHMLKWRNHSSSQCNLTGTAKYSKPGIPHEPNEKKSCSKFLGTPGSSASLRRQASWRSWNLEGGKGKGRWKRGHHFCFKWPITPNTTTPVWCFFGLAWLGMIGGDYLPVNLPKTRHFCAPWTSKTVVQRKFKTWLQKRLDILCSTGVKPNLWNWFVKFLRENPLLQSNHWNTQGGVK